MATATDKRLDNLEGELKLLKNEIKHGMTDVHDFLAKLKLPPTANQDADVCLENRLNLDGKLKMGYGREPSVPQTESKSSGDSRNNTRAPQQPAAFTPPLKEAKHSEPAIAQPNKTASTKNDEPAEIIPKAKQEPICAPDTFDERNETMGNNGNHNNGHVLPVPQVNLLANLVRWVAVARKEIGAERIPTFLDVYGTTGNLTSEIKEVILQLTKVLAEPEKNGKGWNQLFTEQLTALIEVYSLNGQIASEIKDNLLHFLKMLVGQPEPGSQADIWSRLILELHGILAGGGASLQPFMSSNGSKDKEKNKALLRKEKVSDEGEDSQSDPKDKFIKLKFILPSENGDDKEFFIT